MDWWIGDLWIGGLVDGWMGGLVDGRKGKIAFEACLG